MTFLTRRPERERDCPRCRYDPTDPAAAWPPPDHTCRTAPATPLATLAARARASTEVVTERELRIRKERLADLGLWRG